MAGPVTPLSLATGLKERLEAEVELAKPLQFPFPFTPYDIQTEFMSSLFQALEGRRLGIFESPTGTGKSLSMLCGSLTWLRQREDERISQLRHLISSIDMVSLDDQVRQAGDWVKAQFERRKIATVFDHARRELAFRENQVKRREEALRRTPQDLSSSSVIFRQTKKMNTSNPDGKETSDVDDPEIAHLLNDDFAPSNFGDDDESDCEEDEVEEEPEFYPYRIIFASRTHSQIGQFSNELKRTRFAKEVTTACLGSRQNLCINPDVNRLKSLSLINERCLDLQKSSKGKKTVENVNKRLKTADSSCEGGGCPFFNHSGIQELKRQILQTPMDMEDLKKAAFECGACPYYASRKAAKEAQLVMVPYNTILHSGTREGVGLRVNESVILLDEAHNLIESISNMYSNTVSLGQLGECSDALKIYMNKFMGRFSPKNLLKMKQIGHVLKALTGIIDEHTATNSSKVYSVQEFKVAIGIENLDLYELSKFVKHSKLVFKLKGYAQLQQQLDKTNTLKTANSRDAAVDAFKKTSSKNIKWVNKHSQTSNDSVIVRKSDGGLPILAFYEFFKSLLTVDCGGRVILEKDILKFLLLNTCDHFQELIKCSRSIILAGGTMKPYEEIEDQLFQDSKERVLHFSCDHVIPDENLVCMSVSKGPCSIPFDFKFKNRNSPNLMQELGRTLLNFSKIVPGGLVCFLPSYDYEGTLFASLKASGVVDKIESRKKIFREPKTSRNCEQILADYTRQVRNSAGGALLFAVVGGKLSEGINFSDDLGRCVIVVGLPYPNVTSAEIKEKVEYVSEHFGQERGNQLLTSMCWRAINQSIGRAIRHVSDYAAILLIDERYGHPSQRTLLPNWIGKRFHATTNFAAVVKDLSVFFNTKKQEKMRPY